FSAVMLGLCLLAGHPQTALFTVYTAVAWLFYRVYTQRLGWRTFVFSLIFLGMVSGALAAVQLIPTAEFSLHTSRVDMTFEAKGGGFSFAELSTILFPLRGILWNPNYMGLVGLVLIGIAVWRRVPFWGFFTTLFIGSFFLSFGQKTALYGILYPILPGLALFRGQERVMFIMAHSAAVLVGLGTAHLMTENSSPKKPMRQALILLTVICVSVAVVCFLITLTDARTRAVDDRLASASFSALIFGLMLIGIDWFFQQPTDKIRMAALVGLITFDLFSTSAMLNLNYEPVPVRERLTFPAELSDFRLEAGQRIDGRQHIREGYSTLYRIPDISGSDPLQLAPIRTYLEEIPLERQWEILAVSEARPFAHPVYGFYQVNSDDEAYGFLRESAFEVRHLALLEKNPGPLPENHLPDAPHTVTLTRFEPEHIEMEVSLPENAILTLSLPYYPGWQAALDGKDAEILRNYGGLSAVYVPAGDHTLTLQFKSRWLTLSAVVSGAAWTVSLLFFLMTLRKSAKIVSDNGEKHHG
ncbi:MAG: YfhO family protein, partial [Anaerolineae bacterium]|nr:YfhO family protein [Anaerolineae bacterium]